MAILNAKPEGGILAGTNEADVMYGSSESDTLNGLSGNDVLIGGENTDFLNGGPGDDELFGGDGHDWFYPGEGNDRIDGGEGTDKLIYRDRQAIDLSLALGRESDDSGIDTVVGIEDVIGSSFDDRIIGNDQDNLLDGTDGNDQLDGGGGRDRLLGSFGNDVINGGTGNDILEAGYGSDVLDGGAGDDRFLVSQAMRTNFVPGSITSVRDPLEFPSESEILTGGDGLDTAVYVLGPADYQLAKTATGWSVSNILEGVDQLTGIERLEFLNRGSQDKLALDLGVDESAGKAVQFIGMLASGLIGNQVAVGAVLSIFDQGLSLKQVSQIALDVGIVRNFAGSDSNVDLVRVVYRSVLGVEASDAAAAVIAGNLQGSGGSMSQAEFMTAIATHPVNLQHIDLVGLQQSGIAYL